MKMLLTVILVLTTTASVFAADEHKSPIAPNASFDKLKSLNGSWTGEASFGEQKFPAHSRFQLVSDGSALMAWLAEGTPEEMVTIFHMDGNDLMATHYCSAHNQPRFVAVPGGDPNRIVFEFKDGTNIGTHHGHMQQVVFVVDSPDHHVEEWTYEEADGKLSTGRFDFKRKN